MLILFFHKMIACMLLAPFYYFLNSFYSTFYILPVVHFLHFFFSFYIKFLTSTMCTLFFYRGQRGIMGTWFIFLREKIFSIFSHLYYNVEIRAQGLGTIIGRGAMVCDSLIKNSQLYKEVYPAWCACYIWRIRFYMKI